MIWEGLKAMQSVRKGSLGEKADRERQINPILFLVSGFACPSCYFQYTTTRKAASWRIWRRMEESPKARNAGDDVPATLNGDDGTFSICIVCPHGSEDLTAGSPWTTMVILLHHSAPH